MSESHTIGLGDAVFSTLMRDERAFGWRNFKAPKGQRFVLLLVGVVGKDATNFDVDAALNDLGWQYADAARSQPSKEGVA